MATVCPLTTAAQDWPDQYVLDYANTTQLIGANFAHGLGHTGLTAGGHPVRVVVLDTPIRFDQTGFNQCSRPDGADDADGWQPNGADCPLAWAQCIPIPTWVPPPGSGWPLCYYDPAYSPSTNPHGENVARAILSVAPDVEIITLTAWTLKDALDWLLAPNTAFGNVTPIAHFNIVAVNYSTVMNPKTIPANLIGPLAVNEVVYPETFSDEQIHNLRGKFWEQPCTDSAIAAWYAGQVAEGRTWVPINGIPNIEVVKLETEVAALRSAGALLVNAAGNDPALRNGTHFPGCIPGITTVGIIPENYEDSSPELSVALTDHPNLVDIVSPAGYEPVTAQAVIATSFSTPMVSGAIALMKASIVPTKTIDEIEQLLIEHGRPVQDYRADRCDKVYQRFSDSGELMLSERGYHLPEMLNGDFVYSTIDLSGSVYCANNNNPRPFYTKRRLSLIDVINGTIFASLDVDPGSDTNSIAPGSTDLIEVAVLTTTIASGGSANFDATSLDVSTVAFGPGLAPNVSIPSTQDVDGDLDLDVVLSFAIDASGITCDDNSAELQGQTTTGYPVTGNDSITTIECNSGCH